MFECPDADFEEIFRFRWDVLRKHIRSTPDGIIITEFLPPVGWAGKHNSIVCPAGHHYREARWLRDRRILKDYSMFWFGRGGEPRMYSTWLAWAIRDWCLVTGDWTPAVYLLPDLIRNWEAWEASHRHPCGLFWSHDDHDGMEISISGDGFRPTLNSYMYGDARAIAEIARLAGQGVVADSFEGKALELKHLIQERLWDPADSFFKVIPHSEGFHMSGSMPLPDSLRDRPVAEWTFDAVPRDLHVRELLGYIPYYFEMPDSGYEIVWRQITDPGGFHAPFGPTTAERRHPRFMFHHKHSCTWNGPSWPYATTQTLVAMANLLHAYPGSGATREDYFDLLRIYTRSQHLALDDGTVVPWIDENLDPETGVWLARSKLYAAGFPDRDRGGDYNHSGYCDLVITGLVGIRPRADDTVEIDPLLPEGVWDYFRLDRLPYHGRVLAITYDRDGTRYREGTGLRIAADGIEIARAPGLSRLVAPLPPVSACEG